MIQDADKTTAQGRSLSRYYNASQLRADTWNRLKHDAQRLVEKHASKRETASLKRDVEAALDILEPIETYWAFPGKEAFEHLRRLYESEDFIAVAQMAARIVRALVSRSYRRRTVAVLAPEESGDLADDKEAMELGNDERPQVRPYFEVMVVDKLLPNQEQVMQHGLRAMRRAEDQFIYESVFVPSLEDALIATFRNPQIQAVIIRYDFPVESTNRLEPAQRELNRLDPTWVDDATPWTRCVLLARLMGEIRPGLDIYLVTDTAVEDIAGNCPSNVRRVFYQQEDFFELHLNILRGVN